ncbi:MAG: metal ABC transporter ATP-binding protein [Candidatus Yanofskybacteria bacterium]|nr:metal ABC transporter ATP-binding protein [Candidatus Yanofskybacteria bacterium]
MALQPILTVKDLNVTLEANKILNGVNFTVQRGEVLAIVGPNGAGKSVLIRTLLGLIPYSGSISWARSLKISYIPQKLAIEKDFPLNVLEFLNFKELDPKKIAEALNSVGLTIKHHNEHLFKQRLGVLSGGEFQRVLVAWSLLDNPDILLYDEPTGGIDIGGEETIYNLLKRIKENRSLTVVLISHDLNIVYKYADNVICLNKDMICHGIPADVLDPAALARLYGGEANFYQHHHDKE